MKKLILLAVFITISLVTTAHSATPESNVAKTDSVSSITGHNKYQIAIASMTDTKLIDRINQFIHNERGIQEDGQKDVVLAAIGAAFATAFIQKTVNATSNLIDLGVSYVTEAFKKPTNRKSFKSWYSAATGMNNFKRTIKSDEQIDDFYYTTSANGALDPTNMKFDGFVFHSYFEEDKAKNDPRKGMEGTGKNDKKNNRPAPNPNDTISHQVPGGIPQVKKDANGKEIFYLKCSLRKDTLGIRHIAHHSKFYLQIDSLMINPKMCNLPNDSSSNIKKMFSFDTRKDLQFNLNIKVYSSWVNEAILYNIDKQLGEFNISALINQKDVLDTLGTDPVFIYSSKKRTPHLDSLVCITGECFVVPRSFIGSSTKPIWGTGQYRLDMELTEHCSLNLAHYIQDYKEQEQNQQIEMVHVGNTEQASYAMLAGDKKWKKDVWKEEWKQMKSRRKGDSAWKNIGQIVKTAYIGDNWVKEVMDPIATVLIQEETTQLNNVINLAGIQTNITQPADSSSMVGGNTDTAGGQGNPQQAGAPSPGAGMSQQK